ncbi:MAG: biopolymer transporter ExbD [Neptuniibacter sp.]
MRLTINSSPNRARNSLDDSMIPAINIVFLLLIFFMIAGHIEARNEQLKIPQSSSEKDLEAQDVDIQILADGSYVLNGQKSDVALSEALQQLSLSSESIITLHVHRDLPASSMDPVLKSTRQLGIKHLQIATVQQP